MSHLVRGIQDMISKRKQRDTAYVDMDGFKVFYEGIGSKNAK